MQELILSSRQFVEKFGNPTQKKSFIEQNKITTNIKKSLINQAESEYAKVEVIKNGRNNYYVLSQKYDEDERLVRKDGRHANGSYSITYTKDIDLIVLSLLLDKSIETDSSQTMRKWLLDFGLISRDLFELLAVSYDGRRRLEAIDTLVSENILRSKLEYSVIDDYINYTKELQGQLESSLNRMAKANIINFYPVYWAKLNNTEIKNDNKGKRIRISENCVAMINEYKRRLMMQLNVTNFDILTLKNKEQVRIFNKIYKKFLKDDVMNEGEHISIEYFYKAYAIHIKATDQRIEAYLNKKDSDAYELLMSRKIKFMKNHVDRFKYGRLKRVEELAQKKAKYIKKDKLKRKVEDFYDFSDFFGEDTTLDINEIKFNREYYKLFLNDNYISIIKSIEDYYSLD